MCTWQMGTKQRMNERPHILLVEMGTGRGGATRCLLSLVELCRSIDWKVSVATAYRIPELEGGNADCNVIRLYQDAAFQRGTRLRGLRTLEYGKPNRWRSISSFMLAAAMADLPVARRLARYVRSNAVSLIHANNELLVNRAAILAGRLARTPVISHQRGWIHPSWANRHLCRWTTQIIAVSDAIASDLTSANIASEKITRVYDGIDLTRFSSDAATRQAARSRLGYEPQHEVIGLPAVLLPWKGQSMFLEAFARIAKRRPNARALLVGASPENAVDLAPALKRQIADLNLQGEAVMTGHVDDVATMYAAMDVVVHSSVEPEPFGLVVLEAMAAARAVLASNAGGPAEIIHTGRDGILYPMGDAEVLAEQTCQLLADANVRKNIARNAVKRAEQFCEASFRRATVGVYEAVLRGDTIPITTPARAAETLLPQGGHLNPVR